RAPGGSRPGSPPVAALHRLVGVVRLPEVGREVLPAAVGKDGDDHRSLVELARELQRDVDDRAGGHAREDPLPVDELTQPRDRLAVRDEHLPVEIRNVDDWLHVSYIARATGTHRLDTRVLG